MIPLIERILSKILIPEYPFILNFEVDLFYSETDEYSIVYYLSPKKFKDIRKLEIDEIFHKTTLLFNGIGEGHLRQMLIKNVMVKYYSNKTNGYKGISRD